MVQRPAPLRVGRCSVQVRGSGPSDGRAARCGLGGAHVVSARALGALLDVKDDGLAADKAVEIERGIKPTAMEEVFLLILGGDEAEAAIGDDLLDGTGGHEDLQHFPNTERRRTARSRRRSTTRSIATQCGDNPPYHTNPPIPASGSLRFACAVPDLDAVNDARAGRRPEEG